MPKKRWQKGKVLIHMLVSLDMWQGWKKNQVESFQDEQHQLACKQKCKQEEIRDVKTKDHIPFFTLMTNARSMFPWKLWFVSTKLVVCIHLHTCFLWHIE